MGDTFMSSKDFKIGDKVQFINNGEKATVLGVQGEFVWIQPISRGNPSTYHRNVLKKIPIVDPIYIPFYPNEQEFSYYAYGTPERVEHNTTYKVVKLYIDENGNPKSEWLNEQSNT
jgi:hypothetical protein